MKSNRSLLFPVSLLAFMLAAALPLLAGCSDHSDSHAHEHSGSHSHDHEAASHEHAHAIPDEALQAYLAVQTALAADTMDGVAENAAIIHQQTELEAARSLAEAEDIESARSYFEPVSEHLIAAAREHGVKDGVRLAHCPMAFDNKGASWLQSEGQLANPYFGATMLRCGSFRDL